MAGRWLTGARLFVLPRCSQVCAGWRDWSVPYARIRRAAPSPPMPRTDTSRLSGSLTQPRAATSLRMSSMDPGSTDVQEVGPSPRERGVGAAPPQQPTLCLERQEAYIRNQVTHLVDILNPDAVAL